MSRTRKKTALFYLILTVTGLAAGLLLARSLWPTAAAKPLAAPDEILGTVFDDLNGNGLLDTGESGLDGIDVELTNPNGSTTTTASSGGGVFTFGPPDVLTGTHILTLLTPSGYTPTSPTIFSVDKADGVESNQNNFGLQVTTPTPTPTNTPLPASISGYVYHDLNGNGVRDAGETGVTGIQVSVTGPTTLGTYSGSPDGYYGFTAVPDGLYTIQITWGASWSATSATSLVAQVSGGVSVENRNFGALPAATATPTSTSTPTATPTGTSVSRSFTFKVDDDRINKGDCTKFHWVVLGSVNGVTFDGDAVAVAGSQEECPSKTTKYSLVVIWADSTVETKTIELRVKEPTATPVPATPGAATPAVSPTATSVTGSGVAVAVNPYQGRAGEAFAFVGSGFNASEAISVGLAQPDGSVIGLPAQQSNSAGSFAFSYTTKPGDAIGLYTMITEGQTSRRRASAAFIVDDAATPTPVAVVINSHPDGSMSGGVVAGPEPAETPAPTPDPLLSNNDPLLTHLQIVPLPGEDAAAATPAADKQIPGKGGRQ